MKKIFTLIAVAVAMFMVSCASAPASPSEVAVDYYQYAVDGEFEKLVDCIHIEAETPEEVAEAKAMLNSLFTEKAAPQIEAKGGIKSVESLAETVSEDGNEANVQLKITYGDETTKNEDLKMVKVDGKWLMAFDK